jgi:hypothetical protein
MPALQKVIQLAGKALPKVVSPSVHAVADYSTAGLFLWARLCFGGGANERQWPR